MTMDLSISDMEGVPRSAGQVKTLPIIAGPTVTGCIHTRSSHQGGSGASHAEGEVGPDGRPKLWMTGLGLQAKPFPVDPRQLDLSRKCVRDRCGARLTLSGMKCDGILNASGDRT